MNQSWDYTAVREIDVFKTQDSRNEIQDPKDDFVHLDINNYKQEIWKSWKITTK